MAVKQLWKQSRRMFWLFASSILSIDLNKHQINKSTVHNGGAFCLLFQQKNPSPLRWRGREEI